MPVRTFVTNFKLTNLALPRRQAELPCEAGIDGVQLKKFKFKIVGANAVEFPGPPADPVTWLDGEGWAVSDNVPGTNEPSGFRREDAFETLHVEYLAPVWCKCDQGTKKRLFKLTVDYELAENREPKFGLLEMQDENTPVPRQDRQLRPELSEGLVDNSGRGEHSVTVDTRAFLPCPCSEVNPCFVNFTLEYDYISQVIPD
ncbi:MAG: hypothetical protein K2Y71_03750 [Xanthobacteraceae bacterium]|nr:hypothetical protein [Xanthobacteraceae bacterium]